MKIHELAKTIADISIFFEFSPEDILDEDADIQAMEQLASNLQALDPASRGDLSVAFRSIAPSYAGELNRFVEDLPDALGIG